MNKKLKRRLPYSFGLALVMPVAGYALFAPSWDRPAEDGIAAAPLAAGEVRAVTLNAWNLDRPERVPRLVRALRTTSSIMTGERALPELIAIQEIESRDAARALTAALTDTHHVVICECALRDGGEVRSAVAIAAARSHFEGAGDRCIDLGHDWPDHARCAAMARFQRREGPRLSVLTAHLGWRLSDDTTAADALRRVPIEGPSIWLGDFNVSEGSAAYAALTRDGLRDARRGGPPTHFARRPDLVLVSDGVRVVRGLARRTSFDALHPTSSFRTPGLLPYGWTHRACEDRPADCPLSDHLPEGAVLAL